MRFIRRLCGFMSAKDCSSLAALRAILGFIRMKICSGWSLFCRWRAILGVNISGIAIILQMRERMEEMQHQIQDFVQYIQHEVLARASAAADPAKGAIVPSAAAIVPAVDSSRRKDLVASNSPRGVFHGIH